MGTAGADRRRTRFLRASCAAALAAYSTWHAAAAPAHSPQRSRIDLTDDFLLDDATHLEQLRIRRNALGFSFLSAAGAFCVHFLFSALGGLVQALQDPAGGAPGSSVTQFWHYLSALPRSTTADLLVPAVITLVAVCLTLFVAVSISSEGGQNTPAAIARGVLLDSVTLLTMITGAVLCWGAIAYLDLTSMAAWPGAALLGGLGVLLSWLAALSRPHSALHAHLLAQVTRGRHNLETALGQLDIASARRASDGPLGRWRAPVGWAVSIATPLAILLQVRFSTWTLTTFYAGALLLLVLGLVRWAMSQRVAALRRDSTSASTSIVSAGHGLVAVLHLIGVAAVVYPVLVVLRGAPVVALMTAVALLAGPWVAWAVGHRLGHFTGLLRAHLRREIRRSLAAQALQQERLRVECSQTPSSNSAARGAAALGVDKRHTVPHGRSL